MCPGKRYEALCVGGVSWRSLRSLFKTLFCPSSYRYQTDSFTCNASFGVYF